MNRAGHWIVTSFGIFLLQSMVLPAVAEDRSLKGNPELVSYFEEQVSKLEDENELTQFKSLADWQAAKHALCEELFDMFGLSPRPEKSPLQSETTATTEETEFIVERIHFQSLPGLYVTGNLSLPRNIDGPLLFSNSITGNSSCSRRSLRHRQQHYNSATKPTTQLNGLSL